MAILALAVVPAGCGSSFTRHDYVLRAEGICDSTLRSLRLLRPAVSTGTHRDRIAAVAGYLERALPLERQELRKLEDLPKPEQTRAQARALERYLVALEDSVDELGALSAAARAGNAEMFAAAESTLAGERLPSLAAAYGLRACSNAAASYT